MPETYRFAFGADTVYANVCRLVGEYANAGGVHADLGCGYGAIAEPLREAGLTYVGFDADTDAIASLRERGFEAHAVDLEDPAATRAVVDAALAGRTLGSVSMIDTLEHILSGPQILQLLREYALPAAAPLVVSVPNVTHRDLGAKLLTNRFDYTETGLLDHTHVRFFTEQELTRTAARSGWAEVGADDFTLEASDQAFPPGSVALSSRSLLGSYLHAIRDGAGYGATVNQFVRAYLPRTPKALPAVHDRADEASCAVTVLLRTQGRRPHTLRDALLCLLAQTCDDFELIVLAHRTSVEEQVAVEAAIEELPAALCARTRLLVVPDGRRGVPLNRGLEAARGRYITVLDDDDVVFAHWLETFVELGATAPGQMLRAVAVSQAIVPETFADDRPGFRTLGPTVQEFAREFDFLPHLVMNRSPFMSWAFPRQLFAELGVRFDERLSVCEDWDVILRGVMLCGVAASPEVTAIYRRWQDGDASHLVHDAEEWQRTAGAIIARLEEQPNLLPRGHLSRLRDLQIRTDRLAEENAELHQRLGAALARVAELEASTSWKATAPLRAATDVVRHARAARSGQPGQAGQAGP